VASVVWVQFGIRYVSTIHSFDVGGMVVDNVVVNTRRSLLLSSSPPLLGKTSVNSDKTRTQVRGSRFSECVELNPTFLVQGVSYFWAFYFFGG
jgi:hypothetical protein